MGDAAAFAYLSTEEAISDAKLEDADLSNNRTGLIMGSGGASIRRSNRFRRYIEVQRIKENRSLQSN